MWTTKNKLTFIPVFKSTESPSKVDFFVPSKSISITDQVESIFDLYLIDFDRTNFIPTTTSRSFRFTDFYVGNIKLEDRTLNTIYKNNSYISNKSLYLREDPTTVGIFSNVPSDIYAEYSIYFRGLNNLSNILPYTVPDLGLTKILFSDDGIDFSEVSLANLSTVKFTDISTLELKFRKLLTDTLLNYKVVTVKYRVVAIPKFVDIAQDEIKYKLNAYKVIYNINDIKPYTAFFDSQYLYLICL